MGGLRFSTTSAVIATASLLAYQTGADTVSQQHLRKLNSDDYTHLGCFMDDKDDRVMGYMVADDENTTPDFCYDYCVSMDAPLMATQYGIECWCATDVDIEYERHGEGAQCSYPCAGDEDEICGGKDAFDLYLIHSTDTPSDDYTHLGCFPDSTEDRVLGYMLADDENTTPNFCFDYCVGMDAPLMATQYGIECWCATEVNIDYERHGEEAQCNYPCAGDENEMCGGSAAFDLYHIESIDTPSEPEETPEETPEEEPEETPEGAFHEDIVKIIDVAGGNPGGAGWADSYSVGDKCYMQSTFDHEADENEVDTPRGTMTVGELFDILAPGPGSEGRPLYNDVQCGNGPPNAKDDEVDCPGLVEYGRQGCGQIGPMWDLSELE